MFLQLILKLINLIFNNKTSVDKAQAQPQTLITRVVAAMKRKSFNIDTDKDEVNIVYIKGCNADGTANDDKPGIFNDLRMVFRYEGETPRILGQWAATVDPGPYYVQHRINPRGAAQIALGYHKEAWQVGMHRNNHEALVQTGGPVTVYRDDNEDFKRDGDATESGYFGINQHWGYDLDTTDKASAGCLVGQYKKGHVEFMSLVKSDPRYVRDKQFKFSTTVLGQKDF